MSVSGVSAIVGLRNSIQNIREMGFEFRQVAVSGRCWALAICFILAGFPAVSRGQADRGVVVSSGENVALEKPKANPNRFVEGRYLALLIGNNDYSRSRWPSLKTAENDVRGLQDVLRTRYGFRPDDMRTLVNATRREMLGGFSWLAKQAGPGDSVLGCV